MSKSENTAFDMLDEYISRLSNGDKSALADLYCGVSSSIYSYALSVLKNRCDAEDVLQDTLIEIWRAAPGYKRMGKPMAWIITIAKNLCMMTLRSRSKISDEPFDLFGTAADNPTLNSDDKLVINECVEKLSDEERQIVILHSVSGLKHREIAQILELPLPTVLSKYNRAIKKLRKTLAYE